MPQRLRTLGWIALHHLACLASTRPHKNIIPTIQQPSQYQGTIRRACDMMTTLNICQRCLLNVYFSPPEVLCSFRKKHKVDFIFAINGAVPYQRCMRQVLTWEKKKTCGGGGRPIPLLCVSDITGICLADKTGGDE